LAGYLQRQAAGCWLQQNALDVGSASARTLTSLEA